jgi:hypothetical protein
VAVVAVAVVVEEVREEEHRMSHPVLERLSLLLLLGVVEVHMSHLEHGKAPPHHHQVPESVVGQPLPSACEKIVRI